VVFLLSFVILKLRWFFIGFKWCSNGDSKWTTRVL